MIIILVKAFAFAILLGLIGLILGPIVSLACTTFPPGACGMYWLIPAYQGAIVGVVIGTLGGALFGLVI